MALDLSWIDRIHTRLLVRYGAAWVSMWKSVDPDVMKRDWAEQLGGMSAKAIAYALEHLPADRPPATAAAFANLASGMPTYAPALRLDEPKADPERVAAALAKLKTVAPSRGHRFEWAYKLQDREKAGEPLTEANRRMWRDALAVAPLDAGQPMHFNPIPEHQLPPGMREGA